MLLEQPEAQAAGAVPDDAAGATRVGDSRSGQKRRPLERLDSVVAAAAPPSGGCWSRARWKLQGQRMLEAAELWEQRLPLPRRKQLAKVAARAA